MSSSGILKRYNDISFTIIYNYYIKEPVTRRFCNVVSEIDKKIKKDKLISENEILRVRNKFKPGDIIVKRDNYQLTNIGIQGFWKHSGIYIGGEYELDQYFRNIPFLNGLRPTEYLKIYYNKVYEIVKNNRYLIIEVLGEGVVINPVEKIAKVDYLAVMRCNLLKEDIFKSLLIAFGSYAKPYDYLFNFKTDEGLVCSELIYKSYRPTPDKSGINFNLGKFNGKPFLFPNDIVRQFCEEHSKSVSKLKLVLFYDRIEGRNRVLLRNARAFCKSWER